MSQPNFKEQSIAVFGQEAWDRNQAEVEAQIALERASDEAKRITAWFDVFPVNGQRMQNGAVATQVSDEWGRDDLQKRLEKLEAEYGPLMVKHLGLGYLDVFKDGKMMSAAKFADDEAVAQAVAEAIL